MTQKKKKAAPVEQEVKDEVDTNPEQKKPEGVIVLRALPEGGVFIDSDFPNYWWMHYMLNKAVAKLHEVEQHQISLQKQKREENQEGSESPR